MVTIHTHTRFSPEQRRFVRTLIARACDHTRLQELAGGALKNVEVELLTRPAAIPFLRTHLLAPATSRNDMAAASLPSTSESCREVALRLLGVAAAQGSQAATSALRTRARNFGPLQHAAQETLFALPYFTQMFRNRYGMRTGHFALALGEQLLLRLHGTARRNGTGAPLRLQAAAMTLGVIEIYKSIRNLIWRPLASESAANLCIDFQHDVVGHTLAHVVAFVDIPETAVTQYLHLFQSAAHGEMRTWLIHTLEGPLLHAAREGVSIDLPSEDRRLPISFPRRELGLVVRELVHNATKYRDRTKSNPTIWVECGAAMESIRVRDNGIGITRENLAHVGDDGFREHRAAGVDGSGIGLASANARLISIGWRPLEVESIAGAGTTFTLRPR